MELGAAEREGEGEGRGHGGGTRAEVATAAHRLRRLVQARRAAQRVARLLRQAPLGQRLQPRAQLLPLTHGASAATSAAAASRALPTAHVRRPQRSLEASNCLSDGAIIEKSDS